MNPLLVPTERGRPGWKKMHQEQVTLGKLRSYDVLLIGASIMKHMKRYPETWKKQFDMTNINFGISGDRVENVMWRVKNGSLPQVKITILMVGTNNIATDDPKHIAGALVYLAKMIKCRIPECKILISALLPRREQQLNRKIIEVNNHLESLNTGGTFFYLKPKMEWMLLQNGNLDLSLYYDHVHLNLKGYQKYLVYLDDILRSSLPPATTMDAMVYSLTEYPELSLSKQSIQLK